MSVRSRPLVVLSLAAVTTAAASSVGCAARAPAAVAAVPPHPASQSSPPLVVAYDVRGDAAGTLLSGKSDLSRAPLFASTDERDTKSKASLKLRAHRETDGSIALDVDYEERAPVVSIAWSPSIRVAPHARTVVELRGPTWTRAIELTAE